MTFMMSENRGVLSDCKADPSMNTFLSSGMSAERSLKPKVLALSSRNIRMGDITCANTKFQLQANPRINCV